jgi:uncharacterized protein
MDNVKKIAAELNLNSAQVGATIEMLDEGSTVPFISRYRKEKTGSLDEVQITSIRDRIIQLRDLEKRKIAILKSIDEQGKLTPELKTQIEGADTMARLEDLYLPYKPKRKTKASIAKDKGLEPLANKIFNYEINDVLKEASGFINAEKNVANEEEALQGARDIIAERINETAEIRNKMRMLFLNEATISSRVMKGKEQEAAKFKDYFEWDEPIKGIPSHRLLALRRGEKEMFLSLNISPEEEKAIYLIDKEIDVKNNECGFQIREAVKDAYKRLLKPSIETEVRLETKKKADQEAIKVFAENLYELLMAAPLGQKNVLALDPGFRTGCKVVCLNKQGKLLENTTIFPNEPQKRVQESAQVIKSFVEKHSIEAIAIGNGTASRETESFIKNLGLSSSIVVTMVNESGASIYSASEIAREEFPNHDVTVRGAVSIGRRMIDPLAELVKIDAKSIGVGQYQHDVDQSELKKSLDDVVSSCVNNVGVELNTASKQLLTYVSGLGPQLAENIVTFRDQNGPFKSREELKMVPRMGEKAFEQAAGFLRISDGTMPLDRSAVHPERYGLVEKMARDLSVSVNELMSGSQLRDKIELKNYTSEDVGLPTLRDILQELEKPGRDPRQQFEVFSFAEGVNEITDLKVGMELPGIVTNVTKFGAFVDIGVHQDGLVHISQLSDSYVSDPSNVVKVHQKVKVLVTDVEVSRKRISLSMKSLDKQQKKSSPKKSTKEPEGDFQSKLAMLAGKFGKG